MIDPTWFASQGVPVVESGLTDRPVLYATTLFIPLGSLPFYRLLFEPFTPSQKIHAWALARYHRRRYPKAPLPWEDIAAKARACFP